MGLQFSESSLFSFLNIYPAFVTGQYPFPNSFVITLVEPLQSGKLPHWQGSFHPKSYSKARSRNSVGTPILNPLAYLTQWNSL